MCNVVVELKKIDLAPMLEHHFNVCGAKIWHYNIIPPLLQMLLVIIFSKLKIIIFIIILHTYNDEARTLSWRGGFTIGCVQRFQPLILLLNY